MESAPLRGGGGVKEWEQELRGVGVNEGDEMEEGKGGAGAEVGSRTGGGVFCSFSGNNLVQNFHSHGREDKVNGVFLETALRTRYQVYGCHLIFSVGF